VRLVSLLVRMDRLADSQHAFGVPELDVARCSQCDRIRRAIARLRGSIAVLAGERQSAA
jgi:hypothetical protein